MTSMLEYAVAPLLQVDRRRSGGACRVEITGEVDVATAPKVADGIARALDSGAARIYVDLDHVTFCDAAGLTVLNRARYEAGQRAVRLVLVAPSPSIRRLLDLTELGRGFVVAEHA